MGKINWHRVFLGGLLWGVIYNLLGAASWYLFLKTGWTTALEELGRPFPETAGFVVPYLILTLVVGVFALWLYAAIRPRYGPGPKTAACAGFALWVIASLVPHIAWGKLVLQLPTALLVATLAVALVVILAATVIGAWPYKE